ncbi:MAG: hypothetical protein A2270_07285 [Elusimicrobia bacterium RIFOXYA12_FULL_51_18]|nr:MAG: hypothetical protein A2270_07285 [Elusimicrobia bacterium RIFOXYA12_FULL_51_18]OGS28485.1 MAG: hypothetical protein A2218_05590 [Elusimicrobia bacterium RIFOXYA2_FULL_53_38]
MSVFNKTYAGFYDSLYGDKDYKAECAFLEKIFKKYKAVPRSILDLGCGTGAHDVLLTRKGYKVTGVDRSAHMLSLAREKAAELGLSVEYLLGDISRLNLKRKFGAVISMFAVMGYQTTNEAFSAACKLARQSLKPGGVFIFDCWNGFAVLQDKPTIKIKKIPAPDGSQLIRHTTPEFDFMRHLVHINFRTQKVVRGKIIEDVKESHPMRFFFPQEIKYFLESAGYKKVDFYPCFDHGKALTENTWNMVIVAKN